MGKRTGSMRDDVAGEADGGPADGPEHKRTKDETDDSAVISLAAEDFECVICYDLMVDPVVAKCGHDFCKSCLDKVCSSTTRRYQMPSCPVCRTPLATRHNTSDYGVCIRMKDMIERLFPRRSKQRRVEVEQEKEKERQEEEAKQRREAAEREANRARAAAAAARLAMPMDITRLVDSTMQQVADGWGMGFFQEGLHMAQPPLGAAASAAAAAAAAAGGSGPTSAAAAAAAASLPGAHGAVPQTQHMSLTELQLLRMHRNLQRNWQVLQQSREFLSEQQRAAAASAAAQAAADPEDGAAAPAAPVPTGLGAAVSQEPPGGGSRYPHPLQGFPARRRGFTRTHDPRLPYGMGPGLPQVPYGLEPAATNGGAQRWAGYFPPDLGRAPPPGGSEGGDRAGGSSAGGAAGGQRSARGPPLDAGGVAGATGNDAGEALAVQGVRHTAYRATSHLGFPPAEAAAAAAAAAGGHPAQYTQGPWPPPIRYYGYHSPLLSPSPAAEPGAAVEPRSRQAALGAVPAAMSRQPVSVAYYGFDHGEISHAEQASAVMRRPVMGPTDTWMTPPLYMHPQPVVQAAPAAAAAAAAVTGPGAQSIRRSSPLVASLREVHTELQAVQRARSDMEGAAGAAGAAAAAVASANLSAEGAYAAAAADLAQTGRSGGAEHQHSWAPAAAAAADSHDSLTVNDADAADNDYVGGESPTGLHSAASDAAEAYAAAAADLAGTAAAAAAAAAPALAAADAHRGNDSAGMGFAAAPVRGTLEAGRWLSSSSAPGHRAVAAPAASPRHAANGGSTLPLFWPAIGSDDEVDFAGPDRAHMLDAAIASRMIVLQQLQHEQQRRRARRYREGFLGSAPPRRHDGVDALGADRADPGALAYRPVATTHPAAAAAEGPGAAGRQEAGQQRGDRLDLLGLLMDPLHGGTAAAASAAAAPQAAFLAGAGPAVPGQPQALLVGEPRGPAVVQRPAEDLQHQLTVTSAVHSGLRRGMMRAQWHAGADRLERQDGQQQGPPGPQAPLWSPSSLGAALAARRRMVDDIQAVYRAQEAPMLHGTGPATAAAAASGVGAAAALAAAHLEPDARNGQLLARSTSASDSDEQLMRGGLLCWDQGGAGAVASAGARPASVPAAPTAQAAAAGGASAEPLGFDALLPDADNEAALHRANSPHARAPRDAIGGRQLRDRGISGAPDSLLALFNELDSVLDEEAQLQQQAVQLAQVTAPAAQTPPAPAAP